MSGGLLLLRCFIAVVLFSHGVQKSLGWLQGPGLARSTVIFEGLGHHPGRRMVLVAATCEILAATLLALGLFTPLGAAVAAGTLGVAGLSQVFSVKALWNSMGGGEYPLSLAVAALVIGFTGPGAWSIDHAAIVDSWPEATGFVVLGVALVAAVPPALRSFQHFHRRQSVPAQPIDSTPTHQEGR